MKLWVISQYFSPEIGAVQVRLQSFVKQWIKDGHEVKVFVPTPHHEPQRKEVSNTNYTKGPKVFLEKYDGIYTYRHKTKPLKVNKNFADYFKAQLSFSLSLLTHLFKAEHKGNAPDVIIGTSPSLLCCISGFILAKRYNAKFILEVRNVVPQSYINSRILKFDSFYAKLLGVLSEFLYKHSDAIVVLSVTMAKKLIIIGAPKEKIFLVYDGISDEYLKNADRSQHSLEATKIRNELQIHPMTKIVMFLGVFSSKVGLGQILEASKLLLSRNDIIFLMVGNGEDYERLLNMSKGMPNIKFINEFDEDQILGYYACADLLLVPYRDSNEIGAHIPQKMFEVMATKTPSIHCVKGEAKEIIENSGAAETAEPNNPEDLANTIVATFENYETAKIRAAKAPEFIDKNFKHSSSARKYIAVANHLLKD